MEEKQIKATMPVVETNLGDAQRDAIAEWQRRWMSKEIQFSEYIEEVEKAGGDVICGNIDVHGPQSKRPQIEEVLKQYQRGEISIHMVRRLIEDIGGEASFWDWELDKNPNYTPEESKIGFTWNPNHNKKGIFMQNITKRVLIKMCDFIYNSILKYDKDAFGFSDPRLVSLKDYAEKYLINNLVVEHKKNLIRKLVNIVLFVLKEDVYYRVVALKMINEAPHNFGITNEEMSFFNREVPKK